MVVPAGMPGPVTPCPTAKPEAALPKLTTLLPVVVLAAREAPKTVGTPKVSVLVPVLVTGALMSMLCWSTMRMMTAPEGMPVPLTGCPKVRP